MNIGISHPVCAPYKEVNGEPQYEDGWIMGALVSVSLTPETFDEAFHADNTEYFRDKGTTGGTISEELTGMSNEKYAQLLGHKYVAPSDDEPAHVVVNKDDAAIDVGHGYIVTMVDKEDGKRTTEYMIVWLHKAMLSEPDDSSGTTKTTNIEYKPVTFEGSYAPDSKGDAYTKYYFDDYNEAVTYLNKLANITE